MTITDDQSDVPMPAEEAFPMPMMTQPPDEPRLAVRPTSFEHHGEVWADDYEWVRGDPTGLAASLAAENLHTEHWLTAARPLATDMYDRLAPEVLRAELDRPQQQDGWWFTPVLDAGAALPRLVRLPVTDGNPPPADDDAWKSSPAQIVLDLDAEYRRQPFTSVGAVQVSPCGRYVAWTKDISGTEQHTLHVRRLGESQDLRPPVENVTATAVFSGDGDAILTARVINGRPAEVWRYPIADAAAGAGGELVLAEPDPQFRVRIERALSGEAVFVTSVSRTRSRNYVLLGRDAGRLRAVASLPEGTVAALSHLDDGERMRLLVAVRTPTAPNRELRVADVPGPDQPPVEDVDAWPVLLAHSPHREIAETMTLRGRILVSVREAGGTDLLIGTPTTDRPDASSKGWRFLPARVPARNVRLAETPCWSATVVVLRVHSYLKPPTVHLLDLATGASSASDREVWTRSGGGSGLDADLPYTEDVRHAVSADGTLVPMTILRPAGAEPRSAPALLVGYGAYGVSMSASYNPVFVEMVRRGVVVAITHVRGGGENGSTWHDAARGLGKPRSFEDFIACRDHLVDLGWVDPRRVAAHGGSAGGLLIAAAANAAPDKFAALLLDVPFVDPLTTLLNPDLPLTVSDYAEFGDPGGDAEAFAVIRSYSPYHNVPTTRFPPTLASCATEDVRVSPVEALKWTARLRERATGGPFLLQARDGGHTGGSGGVGTVLRYQLTQYAWLMERLGVGDGVPGDASEDLFPGDISGTHPLQSNFGR